MNCGPSLTTLPIQWLCRTKLPHLNDIHQHGLKEGRTAKLPVKARAAFGASEQPLVPRVADSSSANAVNFSSARTTKRFPSSRCGSAIQIVRPSESTAETQPQLQPALGIVDHLRHRFTHFNLRAHFLQTRGKRFNLPLLLRGSRLEVLLLLGHCRS